MQDFDPLIFEKHLKIIRNYMVGHQETISFAESVTSGFYAAHFCSAPFTLQLYLAQKLMEDISDLIQKER